MLTDGPPRRTKGYGEDLEVSSAEPKATSRIPPSSSQRDITCDLALSSESVWIGQAVPSAVEVVFERWLRARQGIGGRGRRRGQGCEREKQKGAASLRFGDDPRIVALSLALLPPFLLLTFCTMADGKLFDDLFNVTSVDKGGKKFDRGESAARAPLGSTRRRTPCSRELE